MKELKHWPENKILTELYLQNNQITGEGAQALAENSTLTSLHLGRNNLNDEGAKALAKNMTLTSLNLENNEITNEGAKALAENKILIELYLQNNQITDEGARALSKSNSLIRLNLENNSLGKAAKEAVSKMLTRNKEARDALLEIVCDGGFEQVQERVHNQGQLIHTMNDKNQTLLHLAAQKGHVKLVSWLCEQGARIDLKDNNDNTPMGLAMQSKHYEVACYLMNKGLAREKQQKAEKESELGLIRLELEQEREKKERELETKDSELRQERQQREESIRELEATKLKLEELMSALLPTIPSDTVSKEEFPPAQGGYGFVYRGEWLGETIALKELINPNLTDDAIKEFKEEALMMARLRSPYVVTVYGITLNAQKRLKGIVMEYMEGGSLDRILNNKEIALSWLVRHKMALAVARGLLCLHQQNIIHNDLKSPNVLVRHYGDEWKLKLTDFGLSKIKQETARFTNTLQGTPAWMAPELFDNNAYSNASDVYAYGIVLWEMVSREIPFKGKTFLQIMRSVCDKKERPPLSLEAPPSLVTLMQLCWKQNKVERLPTKKIITKLKAPLLKQELRRFDDRDNAGGELQNQRVDRSTSSQWSMGIVKLETLLALE